MVPKYICQNLNEEEQKTVRKHFKDKNGISTSSNLVKIVDERGDYLLTLNETFRDIHHLWYNFKVRPDDVWIITSPKCGTTWVQETTWHLMNGVNLEKTTEPLFSRSPFLDIVTIMGANKEVAEEMFSKFDQLPSPRTIKTHFPLPLLPPNLLDACKVIFVNRNIKDAAVSFYYHIQLMTHDGFDTDFK